MTALPARQRIHVAVRERRQRLVAYVEAHPEATKFTASDALGYDVHNDWYAIGYGRRRNLGPNARGVRMAAAVLAAVVAEPWSTTAEVADDVGLGVERARRYLLVHLAAGRVERRMAAPRNGRPRVVWHVEAACAGRGAA